MNICPIRNTKNPIKFLNLGNIPIEGNLYNTKEESLLAKRYPMILQFFPESKLVSLSDVIDKNKIFVEYLYRSGISPPYIDHCNKMYDYIAKFVTIKDEDIVIDVGGNDGTLLKEFRKKFTKIKLINIEGSKSFKEINVENNIFYINEFFGENTKINNKARIITSTNVFQHTEPIRSYVKGIYNNLQNDGIWCLEFPYLLATFISDNYDQAYHEHVYYYLIKPLKELFEQEGLKILNASYHNIHTGTIRLIIAKDVNEKQPDETTQSFINLEKFITTDYCIEWGKKIKNKIETFKDFFGKIKGKGKTIAGFGAAIKGCVFLNTCELDYNTIDFVIDDTKEKQSKFIPGTGIQIFNRDILQTRNPDYILILAHNFKDYIIESLKKQYSGKFIIMFPNIHII